MNNIRNHMKNAILLSNYLDNKNNQKVFENLKTNAKNNFIIMKLSGLVVFFLFYLIGNINLGIIEQRFEINNTLELISFYSANFEEIRDSFIQNWFWIYSISCFYLVGIIKWSKYKKIGNINFCYILLLYSIICFILFVVFLSYSPFLSIWLSVIFQTSVWAIFSLSFFTTFFNLSTLVPFSVLNLFHCDDNKEKMKKEELIKNYKESLDDLLLNKSEMLYLYDSKENIVLEFDGSEIIEKEIDNIINKYKYKNVNRQTEREAFIASFQTNIIDVEIENT